MVQERHTHNMISRDGEGIRTWKHVRVHQVATWEALYGIAGREEVLVADWAVVLEAFLSAYMRCKRPRHASVAVYAVEWK